VSGPLHAPAALPPREELGTLLIRGWVSPDDDVDDFGGENNFFVPLGIRTPDRPARRVEKLLHIGHVQYTFLLPSVTVTVWRVDRLLRHLNYAVN
jgi:hypothetical protein